MGGPKRLEARASGKLLLPSFPPLVVLVFWDVDAIYSLMAARPCLQICSRHWKASPMALPLLPSCCPGHPHCFLYRTYCQQAGQLSRGSHSVTTFCSLSAAIKHDHHRPSWFPPLPLLQSACSSEVRAERDIPHLFSRRARPGQLWPSAGPSLRLPIGDSHFMPAAHISLPILKHPSQCLECSSLASPRPSASLFLTSSGSFTQDLPLPEKPSWLPCPHHRPLCY